MYKSNQYFITETLPPKKETYIFIHNSIVLITCFKKEYNLYVQRQLLEHH